MSDQKKFRITLWAIDTTAGTTGGWRGEQKAVVFDASAVGVEEHANDVGSAFWTLENNHPQIAEFVPLARHYEICRWSDARSRWEFVGAGILNDYSVTEYETTFQGIDYKAVLNQIYTPLSNITFSASTPINPNIATMSIPTAFNQTDGTIGKDNINGAVYDTTGNAYYDYLGDNNIKISSASVEAFSQTTKTIVADSQTASVLTPYFRITYSAIWLGSTTTAFLDTPQWRFRINASPPGSVDSGVPPIGEFGKMAEFSVPADGSSGTSKFSVTSRVVELFPYEAKQELRTALISLGASTALIETAMPDTISATGVSASNYTTGTLTGWALRKGLTYSFQIYGGIHRTDSGISSNAQGYPIWYGTLTGVQMPEVTLGQGTENLSVIVSRVFTNAQTANSFSRIRYAALSLSGSTQTTHVNYSAGQPVLDYLGNLADIEMGAKTDGSKVVFGIDKPTGGATYAGNFKLDMSVSSVASTAIALRYPENIRSFSFTPGLSRVRNDITIIPTEKYLSGSPAQGVGGAQIIGASASDSASLALYGRIPLVAAEGGFINAEAAQNQANRLLNTYKVANSKQVSIRAVLDGIDLWNGWDVGDSVRVTINQGLASVDEPFVISGVRWFGESDGHERIELDLVQGSAFAAAYTAPPATTAS